MDSGTIMRALSNGGNCSRVAPGCGGGLAEYATMAAAGQIPSRFEIGCLVPMQFDIVVPAGGVGEVDQRPRQDALPVALFAELSGADVIIDRIVGPDGDPAGLKGDGIGPTWRPAFFSNDALRSGVNPFPRDVGVATSSKGVVYEVTNTAIVDEDFVGITYAFIAGLEGIAYMSKNAIIDDNEAVFLRRLQNWCKTGDPPNDLYQLGCKMMGNGSSSSQPNGQTFTIANKVYNQHTDGSYHPVP